MSKMEKSNEIEKSDEPSEMPGEKVKVTNPIVVYSDVPGAGPGNENAPASEKEKGDKSVKSAPSDKAVKPKEDK